jgi:hypothetical protein
MVEKIKVGLFALFLSLWILNFFGVYKYFEWLFGQELLTTAGIVGTLLVFPILVAEFFLGIVMLGVFKGIVEA